MSETLAAWLADLPSELRERIEAIRVNGRGTFGRRPTQEIVAEHLEVITALQTDHGASHADLAAILHESGVSARRGGPLSSGTLSSAISRAEANRGRKRRKASSRRSSASVALPDAALATIRQEILIPPAIATQTTAGAVVPTAAVPQSTDVSRGRATIHRPSSPAHAAAGGAQRAAEILNLLSEEKG